MIFGQHPVFFFLPIAGVHQEKTCSTGYRRTRCPKKPADSTSTSSYQPLTTCTTSELRTAT